MRAITVIDRPQGRSLTATDVREHVNLIQEVMRSVMKPDVHYGIIPGCKLPSLWKAGSEVLLTTFRIAVSVQAEDLSGPDCIRYRVRAIGTHQQSGIVIGEGVGECSSDEEKYKWRQTYVKKEFEATPESRRRMKYSEYQGKTSEKMQVRTEPADVANTILKMAKKRAQIDMTLTALAASDCFSQDLEDLPEGLVDREPEPTPEELLARRKAQHNEALGRHSESLDFIRALITKGELEAARQEWAAITPQADQMALWLATDKGGWLTTEERLILSQAAKRPETMPDADREILTGVPK
jgi:hypothetical protein